MRAAVFLATAALALAACSDPTSTDSPDAGLRFEDGRGRHFAATGQPGFAGNSVAATDFAVAFPDSLGGLVLVGFELDEGTRGDLFVLQLVHAATGTTPCGAGELCHGRFLRGLDAANPSDIDERWELETGSVSVAIVGSTTVTGTLHDFVYVLQDGSGSQLDAGDGSFDVPMLSEAAGREILKCFIIRAAGGSCD